MCTLTVCVVMQRTEGQPLRPVNPTSTFDAYNNVRPHYAERRAVGSFLNETQRTALRGFQTNNRRANRRGGLLPFSLLHDRLAAFRAGAGSISARQSRGKAFSPTGAGAFSRLGAIERASVARPLGTAASAIARRRLLISESSRNEPIYRALQRRGVRGTAVHSTIATTPFVPTDRETPQPSGPEMDLHDFLWANADLARNRIRSEAWEHFRAGEYLRAARAFDTVSILDASDHTSRTGELFCHVVVRADHTAQAVFQELVRHDEDMFGHTLGGADPSGAKSLFGDARHALALQNDARVHAGSNQTSPDTRAMYLLVLWYLGETSEAQRSAAALVREYPDSPYAGWPAEMQSVLDRSKPHS